MMNKGVALFIALVLIFVAVGFQASSQQAHWTIKPLNYDPAHQYSGLCGDGQCFVEDTNQDGGNCDYTRECYCVNNAEYLGDSYCDNSIWATRTKQVANALAKFAKSAQGSPNDFSLYCGIPGNALPTFPEELEQNFNNICLLKYGGNVGIGTSLNGIELNQETLDSLGLEINGFADCSGTEAWQKCGSVWFNPSLNATIWLSSQPNSLAASNNPIQTLFDAIKSLFTGKQVGTVGADVVTEMLASTSSFNTVYLSKAGNSQIFAYFEQKYVESDGEPFFYSSIAGEYSNLNPTFAFCDSLTNYCPAGTCSYLCEPAGATSPGTFRIYHIGDGQSSMSSVWQDLASKLRLKSS